MHAITLFLERSRFFFAFFDIFKETTQNMETESSHLLCIQLINCYDQQYQIILDTNTYIRLANIYGIIKVIH